MDLFKELEWYGKNLASHFLINELIVAPEEHPLILEKIYMEIFFLLEEQGIADRLTRELTSLAPSKNQ